MISQLKDVVDAVCGSLVVVYAVDANFIDCIINHAQCTNHTVVDSVLHERCH